MTDSRSGGLVGTGYSGTVLHQKLGLRSGLRVFLRNAPTDDDALIAPVTGLDLRTDFGADIDIAHLFHRELAALASELRTMREGMKPRLTNLSVTFGP